MLSWNVFLWLHVDIFNLFLLLCEGSNIDSLLYVLLPPRILTSIRYFLQFLRFQSWPKSLLKSWLQSLLLSLLQSWLQYWQEPFLRDINYMNCIHLEGYKYFTWYLLLLVSTHHMFYSYIWCHGLVRCIFCVYLTCIMYCRYGFTHNLVTFTPFLN